MSQTEPIESIRIVDFYGRILYSLVLLTTVDPQERSTWRSGVRSAMHADSQLPGKGPTDVDDAPASAR